MSVHPARHLLRAKDLIDARYRDPLDVAALTRAAHASPARKQILDGRLPGELPGAQEARRRVRAGADRAAVRRRRGLPGSVGQQLPHGADEI